MAQVGRELYDGVFFVGGGSRLSYGILFYVCFAELCIINAVTVMLSNN